VWSYAVFYIAYQNIITRLGFKNAFLTVAINLSTVEYSFHTHSQILWIKCAKHDRWFKFGNNIVEESVDFIIYGASYNNNYSRSLNKYEFKSVF